MFQALLAHPQEVQHKRHLVYCVGIIIGWLRHGWNQLALYARNIPNAVSVVPPEDEQIMLETCRGP
jgi:hypothetical protein